VCVCVCVCVVVTFEHVADNGYLSKYDLVFVLIYLPSLVNFFV